jgi:hypothetical protein
MSEGETVELLVSQTNTLLSGVGVFFTVISVYLAGLNYVLNEESVLTKSIAFLFVTISVGMIMAIMLGAQMQHTGLIERLLEIKAQGQLTAAGEAALANYIDGVHVVGGGPVTIDAAVIWFVWSSAVITFAALVYLTFFYKWRINVTPITLGPSGEQGRTST